MILTGILKNVSGGISQASRAGPTFIDALEVAGHPELRNLRGTRYIIDHVSRVIGKEVSIAFLGKAVVAVKHEDGFYKDESLPSLVMANAPLAIAAIIFGVPLIFWSIFAGGALFFGVYLYFLNRVKAVIAPLEANEPQKAA